MQAEIEIFSLNRIEAHTTFTHEGNVYKIVKCIVDKTKEGYCYLAKLFQKEEQKEEPMNAIEEVSTEIDSLEQNIDELDAINAKFIRSIESQFNEIKSEFIGDLIGNPDKHSKVINTLFPKNIVDEIYGFQKLFQQQRQFVDSFSNSNLEQESIKIIIQEYDNLLNEFCHKVTDKLTNFFTENICDLWFCIVNHKKEFETLLPSSLILEVILWNNLNDIFIQYDDFLSKKKKENK